MKKILSLLCLLAVSSVLIAGCSFEAVESDETATVYASFYPAYSLTSLIVKDIPEINLKCLVQPQDDCLRLYDLSDWDASVLSYDADAVVICGGGLESFEESLYSFEGSAPAVINASYGLELTDMSGMTVSEDNSGHFIGENPFIYMSVSGARAMLNNIGKALVRLYPAVSLTLEANMVEADAQLAALEAEVESIAENIGGSKVILFNEALVYIADDIGLDVVYCFDRESGTTLYGDILNDLTEELFKTGARYILIEKQAPAELTLALENAGFTVVKLNVMSSYCADGEYGYIDIQRQNLKNISEAFE